MSSIISLTAAAAILLHTLLGCCLHHQHRCAGENDRVMARAVGVEHCCHSRGQAAADDGTAHAAADASRHAELRERGHQESGPHDCRSDSCEGGACAFLVDSAPQVDLRLDFLAHWTAAADLPEVGFLVPLRCASYRRTPLEPPPQMDCPQSRLCVWLI